MGQPGTKVGELCLELGITRQTLYRHMDPKGQLRPAGLNLLAQRSTPAARRSQQPEAYPAGGRP